MNKQNHSTPRLLIHGGAGEVRKMNLSPELEREYHEALHQALLTGFDILKSKGPSLDAVSAAVQKLEDCGLFNAGYGSVLTKTGGVELDAAIMDGRTLKAGSVAGISSIKNPIILAKLILENTEHVMLIGPQAELFASSQGIDHIKSESLITEKQLKKWQDSQSQNNKSDENTKFGTVGAVAIDGEGNLAAATSTGGIMNKMPGRVGDSPIIGAGTYADNETCAVSTTGQGEFFMRLVTAYDISAQMKYKNCNINEAAMQALKNITQLGGHGGLIALDKQGNMSMSFTTEAMFRGCIDISQCITEIF